MCNVDVDVGVHIIMPCTIIMIAKQQKDTSNALDIRLGQK
jgi:hypothetical protein